VEEVIAVNRQTHPTARLMHRSRVFLERRSGSDGFHPIAASEGRGHSRDTGHCRNHASFSRIVALSMDLPLLSSEVNGLRRRFVGWDSLAPSPRTYPLSSTSVWSTTICEHHDLAKSRDRSLCSSSVGGPFSAIDRGLREIGASSATRISIVGFGLANEGCRSARWRGTARISTRVSWGAREAAAHRTALRRSCGCSSAPISRLLLDESQWFGGAA